MPEEARALGRYLEDLDVARYASTAELEVRLAHAHNVSAERVVVTAGADDALLRLCLAVLEPGRRAAVFRPTFEMIPRYLQLSGGEPVEVPWLDGPVPEDDFAKALIEDGVTLGFVVTPSAPSGEVVPFDVVERLADRAAVLGRLLVVDLAYVEFAADDPTDRLAARGDVVLTRTFSKALGLAGLRVGYAIAPEPVAEWLRTVGQPYAVAAPSLAIATALLDARPVIAARARARVLAERQGLFTELEALGARPIPSQANFVLARFGPSGPGIAERLLQAGYRVRAFTGPGDLEGALRISCPQDEQAFDGLLLALRAAVQDASR